MVIRGNDYGMRFLFHLQKLVLSPYDVSCSGDVRHNQTIQKLLMFME